jgi:hypothetical protein
VRSPKKFNVHLDQKVPFVLACFQASAVPRSENLDSDEKDALFGLDTQIAITPEVHRKLVIITKKKKNYKNEYVPYLFISLVSKLKKAVKLGIFS